MHKILFEIGPLTIYSYGFLMALAFLVCIVLIRQNSSRYDIPFEEILDCLLWVLIGGLIGGRLLYVAINWDNFFSRPLQILAFRDGGMAFQGGLAVGVFTAILVCRLKRISFFKLADILAPYAALGHAIGRVGCFFNGCCYGRVIENGFGVTYPDESVMRIPAQLYEASFLVVLYFFLMFLGRKKTFSGFVFSLYIIIYSIFRFSIEFFRGDNPVVSGGMTLGQVISIITFVCGMILVSVLYVRSTKK